MYWCAHRYKYKYISCESHSYTHAHTQHPHPPTPGICVGSAGAQVTMTELPGHTSTLQAKPLCVPKATKPATILFSEILTATTVAPVLLSSQRPTPLPVYMCLPCIELSTELINTRVRVLLLRCAMQDNCKLNLGAAPDCWAVKHAVWGRVGQVTTWGPVTDLGEAYLSLPAPPLPLHAPFYLSLSFPSLPYPSLESCLRVLQKMCSGHCKYESCLLLF